MCFSSTENHLSGRGVGSDHDAGTYFPCSDRVNPHFSQESKRRPVTHCQAVSKTAKSDVSCIQRDTFWPAVRGTPTVLAQDHGIQTHFARYGGLQGLTGTAMLQGGLRSSHSSGS